MTTLAFGQMLFFLYHDTPLGGGADGIFVTRPTLSAFGFTMRPAAVIGPGSCSGSISAC